MTVKINDHPGFKCVNYLEDKPDKYVVPASDRRV